MPFPRGFLFLTIVLLGLGGVSRPSYGDFGFKSFKVFCLIQVQKIRDFRRKGTLSDDFFDAETTQRLLELPLPELGRWHSIEGACAPCSRQLLKALKKIRPQDTFQHFEIDSFQARNKLMVNGRMVQLNPGHDFLIRPAKGEQPELIVDPTYLQYIDGVDKLSVPKIFVGTREELVAFFTKHRLRISPRVTPRNLRGLRGHFDPEDFVNRHYGFGDFASTRTLVDDDDE